MKKTCIFMLLLHIAVMSAWSQTGFPVQGQYYRLYNTVRKPGQKLYWTASSSAAYSALYDTEGNSQIWEFIQIENPSGAYKYYIKSYETGKYLGAVAAGGHNIPLYAGIASAGRFAIEKVAGEDTYTFRTGTGIGNYLFCDSPGSDGNYRLDGWKAEGNENFYVEIAEPTIASYTYTLFSAGMPDGATITIDGKDYKGVNAQGNVTVETSHRLSAADIIVTVGGGMGYELSVDQTNMQVNVDFKQMFIPSASATDGSAMPYLLKMPKAYVRVNGSNIVHTTKKGEADRFLFIEDAQNVGQYYIYDATSSHYIYYTNASNGSVVKQTSASNVKMTGLMSSANTWKVVLGADGETVYIVPGSIATPTSSSPAWNFTGGVDNGCVLNLWTASDSNSAWNIIDPSVGSMACATTTYALPDAEYIHKLIPNEGETVVSVDFGSITTMALMEDRVGKGNDYKYVYGKAPAEEGMYTYVVKIADADGKMSEIKVNLTVDAHLQSPTPMLGWLTWNWFNCNISHDKLLDIAKGMKAKGLVDAGYNALVIDDGWATNQSDKSKLTYHPQKFPYGIEGFVQAVKQVDNRLLVGIYSDAGSMTCANVQPGSYGFERPHMELWDSWGVDMLKYDYCNSEDAAYASYRKMGAAINEINAKRKEEGRRPFIFNICEWGSNQPWNWGAEAGGSSWRATYDQRECWVGTHGLPGVITALDEVRPLWMYSGVNRFNDMDMMVIGLHGRGSATNYTPDHTGNGGVIKGLSDEQARSQMSLWCMLSSPLAITCDLRETPVADGNSSAGILPNPLVTDVDLSIMTNADILSINQDALGQQAEYMRGISTGTTDRSATGYDVYVKDLSGGRKAVAIFNRSAATISTPAISLQDLYMDGTATYIAKNVWEGTEDTVSGTIAAGTLAAYQTRVYIMTKQDNGTSVGSVNADTLPGGVPVYNLAGQRQSGMQDGINVMAGKVLLKK